MNLNKPVGKSSDIQELHMGDLKFLIDQCVTRKKVEVSCIQIKSKWNSF